MEKEIAYKIQTCKEFHNMLKHVWRLIITDLIQDVLRDAQVIDKGVGMGWGLSKNGPFGLIETTTELMTTNNMTGTLLKNSGIETLVAFACLVSSPGISLDKTST
jgi:hypothetical protein